MNFQEICTNISKIRLDILLGKWAKETFVGGTLIVVGATLNSFSFDFDIDLAREITARFKLLPSSVSDLLSTKTFLDLIANSFLFFPFGWGLTQILQKRNINKKLYID